jgi:MoaA/NifB/PqqE/SkfB family radical SAM enzyme
MSRMSLLTKLGTAVKFPYLRMAGYPTLINLEVTKRCNARCDFCDYWKTTSEEILDDYVPVVKKLQPLVVMITGGEPFLRRDLANIVGGIRKRYGRAYIGVITNGALLKAKRSLELWDAGLDQITVSLDFLDERHDKARGIPGLTEKISKAIPELLQTRIDNIVLNSVIKADNLDQIIPLVQQAEEWGTKISFSTYADVKVGNSDHNVTSVQMSTLEHVISELLRMKSAGSPILSSPYYLSRIPQYFERGSMPDCVSGDKFVTVTPSGHIKRCSEFPEECHYTDWTPTTFGKTDCDVCWFSCRGESEAPISIERVIQSIKA